MPAPIRVSHVFLDVDGTLVDFRASMRAGIDAAATYLSERAGRAVTPAALLETRTRVLQQRRRLDATALQEAVFHQALRERGIDDAESVREASRRFFEARDGALQPYDDVVDTLATLRGRGFVLTAATNGSAALMRTPVFDLLDHAFSAEEAGVAKPHPGFYEAALAKAGAAAATSVMVGDRIDNDLEPAASVGMHAVLIDRDRRADAAQLEHPVVHDLRDLPDLLQRIDD